MQIPSPSAAFHRSLRPRAASLRRALRMPATCFPSREIRRRHVRLVKLQFLCPLYFFMPAKQFPVAPEDERNVGTAGGDGEGSRWNGERVECTGFFDVARRLIGNGIRRLILTDVTRYTYLFTLFYKNLFTIVVVNKGFMP